MSSSRKHSGRLRRGDSLRVSVNVVQDGDSCIVNCIDRFGYSANSLRVRLHAIDAPEIDQPFGIDAADQLRKTIQGKIYTLRVWEPCDRYERVVGALYKNKLNRSVNRHMVRQGLAFRYADFGEMGGLGIADAEKQAKDERRGCMALASRWNAPLGDAPAKPRRRK